MSTTDAMENLGGSGIDLRKSESEIKREIAHAIAFKYFPLASSAGLATFASTLLDPTLLQKFGPWSETVRNTLWVSSCAGLGMWMYDRPHLKQVSQEKRAFFALGLGSLFVHGSALLCVLAKKFSGGTITNPLAQMLLGASLAGGCLHFGKSYIELVDREELEEEDDDGDEN